MRSKSIEKIDLHHEEREGHEEFGYSYY